METLWVKELHRPWSVHIQCIKCYRSIKIQSWTLGVSHAWDMSSLVKEVVCFGWWWPLQPCKGVKSSTLWRILGFDLWLWFYVDIETLMIFLKETMEEFCVFLKWKICLKNYVVTSWYQSLGLRDSDTPSGISELKLRIWEKFSKRTEKCSVYNQPTPERWFPKIPLRYVLCMLE